ncbi:MAG: hypothetical protein AXA67_03585 [Methylothermaceae bacteria B42]|nr:MAG: hypothetical protein AXA67_03585 [Methylothermaceae bacteria B42]HHJ38184.1 cyclic nucleotide-binding domain-containing protein [Methylothermaceae bacterium]
MDWKIFLQNHPVFANLSEKEIDHILSPAMSEQQSFEANQMIFRIGEPGNSIFLIGSGSVEISLLGADRKMIPLTLLRKGEFFGEIAVFDQKPRSATAITTEASKLLEIRGKELLNLAREHPEMEFKFLMHLSTRLRDVGDHVMAVKVQEVDEKIQMISTRLDAELKVIDASLKAAQTVFDHTSSRAKELIESVERSRSRMTIVASLIGAGLSTIVAVFGLIGLSELQDVKKLKKEITQIHTELAARLDSAKNIENQIQTIAPKIDNTLTRLGKVDNQIQAFQQNFFDKVLLPRFYDSVDKDTEKAMEIFETILNLDGAEIEDTLFLSVLSNLLSDEQSRQRHANVLIRAIREGLTHNHRQQVLSYYLLLTALAINDDKIASETSAAPILYANIQQDLKNYLTENPNPVKATLKRNFGIWVMRELLSEAPEKTLKQVEVTWNMIP